MKWTNALGTISAVLSFISLAMIQLLHCSSTGDLTAKCETDLIPAPWLAYTSMFFLAVTLALKAVRPGGFIASMFGQTAVVVPDSKSGPGVVTKAQVAAK
jgi:hypothetical protein